MQTVHKEAWDSLVKNHGSAAADPLLSRLRQCVDSIGTLHVLRHRFDVLGLRKELRMAQFKPANAMNPEITAWYNRNRLRIVRQVRYSMHSEDCTDLVLFLNGISVCTPRMEPGPREAGIAASGLSPHATHSCHNALELRSGPDRSGLENAGRCKPENHAGNPRPCDDG